MQFTCKYGAGGSSGTCWAYWLRRRDTDLDPAPVDILDSTEIHHDDPDLEAVLKLYRPNTRWARRSNAAPRRTLSGHYARRA